MVVELSSNSHPRNLHRDRGLESVKLIDDLEKYRTSRTGNRQTRTTQIDHDVFEGLPVRHWRKKPVNINTAPEKDISKSAAMLHSGYKELPLPRDFSMLPENSQTLLRAARMGVPRGNPTADEDKENEVDERIRRAEDSSFIAHRWTLVPGDAEGPKLEFLAKRRKGLPPVYSGLTVSMGGAGQMRKTKVRKVDADGNNYIWEVLVPEGQTVDGEVIEDEAIPTLPPAPGTVVEGLGVVNHEGVVIAGEQAAPATSRRRPPIPKKRKHGPGRGRKKKIEPIPGVDRPAPMNGAISRNGVNTNSEHATTDGVPRIGVREQTDGDDSIMQDAHPDDEEASEEGSDGEEGEEGDREGELSPSPSAVQSPSKKALSTASIAPHIAEEVPIFVEFGQHAMVGAQSPILAAPLHPDDMEMDLEEPAMMPIAKIVETDIATSNGSADATTSGPPVEAPTELIEEEIPAVHSANDAPLPSSSQANTSEEAAVPPPASDEMVFSDHSSPLTASSSQSTAAQEATAEISNTQVPPAQEIVTPPQQVAFPATDVLLSPVPHSASKVEAPPKISSQASQDSKSSPPIPHTPSQFPEPPATLPERPPTPSPQQRWQQHAQSVPSDNHRRPSGSTPKAPTPSPPTPIEALFDNLSQGLSPRAPTMSPPTPIGGDSSPETALADQHRKPPPLSLPKTGLQNAIPRIPGLQYLPEEQQVDVEAAPKVDETNYNAELPHEHNPLDGLKAPEMPSDAKKMDARDEATEGDVVRFEDGGEDLLGTLERSLEDVGGKKRSR
ncbi:MAG: hypothetical protein Q9217_006519 [Psora testacea]